MTLAELHQAFERDDDTYAQSQCERFSALLQNDLNWLDTIEFQEQRWKSALKNKEILYDPDFDREITRRYGKWLDTAKTRLEQIKMQRELGFRTDAAAEFESRVDDMEDAYILRLRSEAAAQARYQMLHEAG